MNDEKNPPSADEQNLSVTSAENSNPDSEMEQEEAVSAVRKRSGNEYFRQMAIDKAIEREREKQLRNADK